MLEHLISGEKIVRLYELSQDQINTLREEIITIEPEDGQATDAFPFVVDPASLQTLQQQGLKVLSVEEREEGTAIILGSVRYLTSREVYDSEDVPENVLEAIGDFDELVAVRRERHQAFDVLWVPNEGTTVEMRIDHPFGTPFRKGLVALDAAEVALKDRLTFDPFQNQLNLFPAIQGLYDENDDGVVIELAFMVSGSAQKLERTRRGRLCCRSEAYHLAGKAGLVDPIEPYLISVLWSQQVTAEVNSYPEVALRGTSIMTGQPEPFLGEMVVRNCTGTEDFDFVVSRILHHA